MLSRLYGLSALEPPVQLLLQHRAVLFGLLALPMLIAMRQEAWRLPAASLGLLSVLSFIGLALWQREAMNAALWRVFVADLLILPLLLGVWLANLRSGS